MRMGDTTPKADPSAPSQCPFCKSTSILTTSKLVSETTYWRCHACGQIWNALRLRIAPPRRGW